MILFERGFVQTLESWMLDKETNIYLVKEDGKVVGCSCSSFVRVSSHESNCTNVCSDQSH